MSFPESKTFSRRAMLAAAAGSAAGASSVTDAMVLVGTGAGPFLPGDSLVCFGR